ncbi:unnamed protein product [Ceratitis capitata]|uniref:(Mediterranean fruit fly) hypothetical protein n=1 Tax=Ceratitis capitata TaxID=7213 RepID=A0A811UT71_CERCA|nr:unnamed protein product [Ceratitis capitata]
MPYSCVKCALSHGPEKCTRPIKKNNHQEYIYTDQTTGKIMKLTGIPLKCANRETERHTANSNVCPVRIEVIKRKEIRMIEKERLHLPTHTQNRIQESSCRNTISYAAKVKENVMTTQVLYTREVCSSYYSEYPISNQFNALKGECLRLFGSQFTKCMQKIGEFSLHFNKI